MDILSAHGLGVRRGRRLVVHDLDLTLPAGRITALLGPNGSGKTSTMLGLLGILPTSGRIEVFGATTRDAEARRRTGFVPQDGGIPTGARAMEWIALQAGLRHAGRNDVAHVVDALRIAQDRRLARRLSGGERRRVVLAAALVGAPELLILDEPTAGLDPEARAVAISMIRAAADAGAAVLLSTHLLDEVVECADTIGVMRDGRLIRLGPSEALLSDRSIPWSPAEQADELRRIYGSDV